MTLKNQQYVVVANAIVQAIIALVALGCDQELVYEQLMVAFSAHYARYKDFDPEFLRRYVWRQLG